MAFWIVIILMVIMSGALLYEDKVKEYSTTIYNKIKEYIIKIDQQW